MSVLINKLVILVVSLIDINAQLQELKQRASGNVDEPFVNPGISDKQPLHVVMVSIMSFNKKFVSI